MTDLARKQIAESQRLDKHYYAVARSGYDATTGERDVAALSRYAARRSSQTRKRLFNETKD